MHWEGRAVKYIIQGSPLASWGVGRKERGETKGSEAVMEFRVAGWVIEVARHDRIEARVRRHELLDLVSECVEGC